MKTIISEDPFILDYSHQSDDDFIHHHLAPILKQDGNIKSGVNGLCKAGAFGRLMLMLYINEAPQPKIVKVIKDPESELTYELQ